MQHIGRLSFGDSHMFCKKHFVSASKTMSSQNVFLVVVAVSDEKTGFICVSFSFFWRAVFDFIILHGFFGKVAMTGVLDDRCSDMLFSRTTSALCFCDRSVSKRLFF